MNAKSIKKTINLMSEISMSRNHSVPDASWSEFDDNNAPVYNNALSPLYYTEGENNVEPAFTSDGSEYKVENGILYKNGNPLLNCSNEGFVKKEINAKSDTFCKDFYVEYAGGFVNVYDNAGNVIHTATVGNSELIVDRVESINGKVQYFGLFSDEDGTYRHLFINDTYVSPLHEHIWRKDGGTQTTSNEKVSTPKIYFHNYNGTPAWFIVNMSGPRIDGKDIRWFSLINNEECLPYTVDRATITTTKSKNITFSGSITQTLEKSDYVCTKSGDNFIDEDGTVLTFSEGFVPTPMGDGNYSYSIYKAKYTYVLDSTDVDFTKYKVNFNLNDLNRPDEVPNKVFSVEKNRGTSFSLEYTSNFAYIQGRSLADVDFEVTVQNDYKTEVMNIPNAWVTVTSSVLNHVAASPTVKVFEWEETTSNTAVGVFTSFIMQDDGYWYGYCGSASSVVGKSYNMKNRLQSFNNTAITIKPEYTSAIITANTGNGAIDKYFIDLGQFYFRSVFLTSDKRNYVYDSVLRTNGGYNQYADGSLSNGLGYKANVNGFGVLYNNGYVQGISYNNILLTSWQSIDVDAKIIVDTNSVTYKNVNGKWYTISITENKDWSFNIVEDRYIVVNTTSYDNCFDTKLNRKEHYASDWNNRLSFGTASITANIKSGNTVSVGSGENVVWEVSESTLTSAMFPASVLTGADTSAITANDNKGYVEVFIGDKATLPSYVKTLHRKQNLINSEYDSTFKYKLSSGASMYYNPSLFTKFLYSGNNKDFIVDDSWAYSILYDNNVTPIIIADSSSYVDNMEALFVIQSMPYGIMGNKLYSLSYLGGAYQGADAICNIKGMVFCGNIPTRAFFYSPLNRSLYAFTGDANLTKVKDATAIGMIYNVWYNSSTQTIYIATDNGLYMISDKSSFRHEFYNVKGVYFIDDGSSYVVNFEDGKYVAYHLDYEWKEGFKTNKVRLDSGLLGVGDDKWLTIDRYSFTFWNDNHFNGTIKIKSYILTDKGTIEDEYLTKEVKTTDWDKEYHSILIDYVPKKNRGLGVGFMIESDFAISNITASVTPENETAPTKIHI